LKRILDIERKGSCKTHAKVSQKGTKMKRIFLTAIGIAMLLSSLKAQTTFADTTTYKSRKLKLHEINLVSSYYAQNGDHASVTGGIGSQKLHDIANIIDVNLIRYTKHANKQTLAIALGIDYYTSASSDQIDHLANSSASHADLRTYPSINFSSENAGKRVTFNSGISTSSESDYESKGANIGLSKKSKNGNAEFAIKSQIYLDKVSIIKPVELRSSDPRDYYHYPTKPRNTFALSLSYLQVINQRLQGILLADLVQQKGYLSLPFHRVYFTDSTVHMEKLPASRFKIPIGLRLNYFAGDKIIIRSYYRFYHDDWGLTAHTADIEFVIKINPFFSISPFYRFYSQTAIKYFAPFQVHTSSDAYYTSNYDYSRFNSNFAGTGLQLKPPKGIFNNKHFTMLEFRYGHYEKTVQLNSDIISLSLGFR
jgi:Protein of unknown function (DUF3570)